MTAGVLHPLRQWLAAAAILSLALGAPAQLAAQNPEGERRHLVEQLGAVAVVQFYADGFDRLTPKQRLLAYYLAEAGIAGDPIYYDEISPYGLEVKQLLEGIWTHPQGIEAGVAEKLRRYTKLIWVYHGNYDLDSGRKFLPEFTAAELRAAARQALKNGANFGVKDARALDGKVSRLEQPIFDPHFRPELTVKNPPPGKDILTASGSNRYENVTLAEVEKLHATHGLNSRVAKRGGKVFEEVFRAGTPDGKVPSDWYAYNIAWVKAGVTVDAINGFIEQYLDPRSEKGAYESVVSFVDTTQTKLMRDFAASAQYFENRAPWREEFKKQNVQPPVANVITVVSEAGEAGPISPSGINLPNEQDIRQQYGSKSVLLFNVSGAFAGATGEKASAEFSASEEERQRAGKYRQRARNLLVAMHEVIGHGSGKVSDRLQGDPRSHLKEYYAALEEARADLVALWDFPDPKLAEMGIRDQDELMKAAYDNYARQALVLLTHYPQGEQVIEDHDRGTNMIVHYLMDRFGCIEEVTRDGKIYLRVSDYSKMRQGVGELLAELMRIKAEGDYDGMKKLMDTYGVKLDPAWRDQVVQRAARAGLPRKAAFISPLIEPVRDAAGKIIDARIRHAQDFAAVMLIYSRKSLGYLPAR